MVSSSQILNAKILIVDDLQSSIDLLKLMLGNGGYTALSETKDPLEVCELHRKNRYDLILLDLLMPGMYGFQVIEGLREIEPDGDLPVLVVSAEPDYKMRAMQAGAKAFITKPLDRAEVLGLVHAMLQERLSSRMAQSEGNAIKQAVQERTARLRDSEALFRQVATFSPDALWIREVKGGLIRYVNPAWEKITGQRLAAGDRPEKVFEAIHPDDLPRVLREADKLSSGGVDLECRIVLPDNVVHWVHFRTFAIRDSKQRIVRIAGILQDITARRTAANGDA